MLRYKPSTLAAASVYLSFAADVNSTVPTWPETLERLSGCSAEELRPIAVEIASHVNKLPVTSSKRQLNAVKKKFEQDAYCKVGMVDAPSLV